MSNNKRLVAEISLDGKVLMTIDNNLLNAEFGALDRGNITDVVNWGVYANRGSLSFIDTIDYFNNYNVNSAEIKKHEVIFYLQKENRVRIATFNISDCKYDDETKRVDVELSSKLLLLQNQKNNSYFASYVGVTLYSIMENFLQEDIFHGEDSSLLDTIVYCTFIEPCTDWEIMSKICQASMCRVYENSIGGAVISGSFPNRIPIIIEPRNIINIKSVDHIDPINPSIDVTNRNKYLNDTDSTISLALYSRDASLAPSSEDEVYQFEEGLGIYSCHIETFVESKQNQKILAFSNITKMSAPLYFYVLKDEGLDNDVKYDSVSFKINYDYSGFKLSFFVREAKLIDYESTDKKYSSVHTSISFKFNRAYFEDGEIIVSSFDENPNTKIESNDLIQSNNIAYYNGVDMGRHGAYILRKIKEKYGKGIECVELECLFNNYYDEQGNLVYDGNQLRHFEKYDTIIPYVMKQGERVPFRLDEYGDPMVFRIIGIEYSYDGLLKQKLHLHQER